jgi:hypothetical protein
MATPSKAKLIATLEGLGFSAPEDASSADLQKLVRQARALPRVAPQRPPRPAQPPPAASMPPAPAQRPSFALPVRSGPLAQPAVPPPPPRARSDHEARPWDPHAGW